MNMKQTPVHEVHNQDLLELIPRHATKITEVGCSSGALAREYKKINPQCHYIGVEIDPDYAEMAGRYCDETVCADIEDPWFYSLADFESTDCWVFGDTLEHLRDPWKVLSNIREHSADQSSVVACIPNAQHWSIQARLNVGDFRYEDSGLLDRTHLRWFTRSTMVEMFQQSGFRVEQGKPRIFKSAHPNFEGIVAAIRQLAIQMGGDPDMAVQDALPLQYVVRAVPA